MKTKSKQKNVDEHGTSSHREQRLVLLSSEESQRAIKWARDHAEELEKFHRREGEYYAELPRSAGDHGNAELYARFKRAMEALLEQNVHVDAQIPAPTKPESITD